MPIDDEAVRRLRALAQDDARPEPSRDGSRSRGGEVVGDRFEIDDAIGEGGMGVVYRALDRDTRAVVALKLVRIENAAEEERFAREVAAVAGLQHPGIVRYVAHGASRDGERFLATELLHGVSLAERLARGALDVGDAIAVARRAADALAAAHRAGIVHRDVKPSNLFLVGEDPERCVLLDFGVARPRDAVNVTRTGTVIGTACYVAPEQVRSSRDVDARADVFALGLVLFECLSGRAVFAAENTEAALTKVLLEEAPRLGSLRPGVPASLEDLVGRMIAKSVDARPENAAAVAAELAAIEALEPTRHQSGGTGPAPRPMAGQIIGGRYEVEGVLGEGGMGFVVAARHKALDRRVAIKLLRSATPADQARFLREARAASQLDSEHAVRVLDFGADPGSAPYMVMELLEGADLAEVIRRRGPLACAVAATYLLQAAEAIAEAHARGIVHRDLKPSNLFLTTRPDGSPHVKVLDFGISKHTDPVGASSWSLTAPATVLGSPRYMSPEQLKSARDVDARTDVWALGAVLYELVSGRPAFDAPTAVALAARIASEPPEPLDASVPADVERIVRRCLAKDPSDRFATIDDLTRALGLVSSDGKAQGPSRRGLKRASIAGAAVGIAALGLLARAHPRSTADVADPLPRSAAGPSAVEAPRPLPDSAVPSPETPNPPLSTPVGSLAAPRESAPTTPKPARTPNATRSGPAAARPPTERSAPAPSAQTPAAAPPPAGAKPRPTVDPFDPALEGR